MANIKITITDGVDPKISQKIRNIGNASRASDKKVNGLIKTLSKLGVNNTRDIATLSKATSQLATNTNKLALSNARLAKINADLAVSQEKLKTQKLKTAAAEFEVERSMNRAIASADKQKIANDQLVISSNKVAISAQKQAQAGYATERAASQAKIALTQESIAEKELAKQTALATKATNDSIRSKVQRNAEVHKGKAAKKKLEIANNQLIASENKITATAARAAAAIKKNAKAATDNKRAKVQLGASQNRLRTSFINMGTAAARQQAILNRLAIAANKAGNSVKRLTTIQINSTKATFASIGGLARNIRNLSLLAGVAFSGVSVVSAADSYTILDNKVKTVSTSQGNLNVLMEKQFEVANRVRVPVGDITKTFIRLDLALQQLGRSQADSLRINETINKALIVSGANTSEASAATLQLSQAFNKGKLDGDEFRSVMELMPVAANAIAKELGVTRGELLLLAPEGKITAEVMANAFLKAGKDIDAAFAKTVPTIGQSFVVLGNKITEAFGKFNKANGITANLAKGIIALGDEIGTIIKTLAVLSVATVAYFAATSIAALAASASVTTLTAAIAANPLGLIATGIAAALSYAYLFGDEIEVTSDGLVTLQDVAVVAWRLIRDGAIYAFKGLQIAWEVAKTAIEVGVGFVGKLFGGIWPIVKNTGNIIIATFQGAFAAVGGIWDKFPSKMLLLFLDVQGYAVDLAQKVADAWLAAKKYILQSVAELNPIVAEILVKTNAIDTKRINVADYGITKVDSSFYDKVSQRAEGTINPLQNFVDKFSSSIEKDYLGSAKSAIAESFMESDFVKGWQGAIEIVKGEIRGVGDARRKAAEEQLKAEKKRQEELDKLNKQRIAAMKGLADKEEKAEKARRAAKIKDYGFVKDFGVQAQSNDVSCGQCSVASMIGDLGGKDMTDRDINSKYGFRLEQALAENSPIEYKTIDLLSPDSKEIIKNALRQGFPVTVGLNGPEFSPSGRGHIVKGVGFEGDNFRYMDPNRGRVRDTTFTKMMASARNTPYPSSQGGPFAFVPKSAGSTPANGKEGNRMQMEASKRARKEFDVAQKKAREEEARKKRRTDTLSKLNIELNTELKLATKLGPVNQAEIIVLTELEKLSKKGIELDKTEMEVLTQKSAMIAKAQEYQKAYNSVISDSSDSVEEYEKKLKANKDALNDGAISVRQYNANKTKYNDLIFEALDPMKKENEAMVEQLRLSKMGSEERETATALKEYENTLTKKGIVDLTELIAKRKEDLQLLKERNAISSAKDQIKQNSEAFRKKGRGVENEALAQTRSEGNLSTGDLASSNMDFFDNIGIDSSGFKSQLDERRSLYNEHIDALDERLAGHFITQKEHSDAVMKLKIQRQSEELTGAEAMFGAMAQLQDSGIKELATVGKAAAIAQALVNTYQSVTGTWAYLAPLVGPVGAAAGAAGALAAGMANVAQIRSQNVGYMSGGYTGNGGVTDVAGVVHGQEFVMNARATQRIGVDNLYRMQDGRSPQGLPEQRSGGEKASPAPVVNAPVNAIVVSSQEAALEAFRGEQGTTVFLELLENNQVAVRKLMGA